MQVLKKKDVLNGIEEIIFMEFSHSDIDIGTDIAKCFITILKLVLVLQSPLREYWSWNWYCKIHYSTQATM